MKRAYNLPTTTVIPLTMQHPLLNYSVNSYKDGGTTTVGDDEDAPKPAPRRHYDVWETDYSADNSSNK